MTARAPAVAAIVAIVLGTALLAFSAPANAIVCTGRLGCPKMPSPPPLSTALMARIVKRYLAQHPPVVRLELRQPLGSYAPVAYDDLARAGLLHVVDGRRVHNPRPQYDLTARGDKRMGTFFSGKRIRHGPYHLDIPVGTFRYVPGSVVPGRDDAHNPTVTFRYDFVGNANATTLLRLAPAMDWIVSGYALPYVNLRDVGRIAQQTLPLRLCYGQKWMVAPPHPCGIP